MHIKTPKFMQLQPHVKCFKAYHSNTPGNMQNVSQFNVSIYILPCLEVFVMKTTFFIHITAIKLNCQRSILFQSIPITKRMPNMEY